MLSKTIIKPLRFAAQTNEFCNACVSLISRSKFCTVSLPGAGSQTFTNTSNQFQSVAKLCNAAENDHRDAKVKQVHSKKRNSGGKKKRRLSGEGSILTDPGVPVPSEMRRDELIECLVKSALIQDDVILINKPAGLRVSEGQDPDELSFVKVLPDVAEQIGYPSAEFVHGPEKETSGLILLGHNNTSKQKLSDAYLAAKKSRKLIKKFWAVTVGIPSPDHDVINDPIGYERIADKLMGIVRHDPTKASFKRIKSSGHKLKRNDDVNKKAETHYQVLSSNDDLKCALVELQLHSFTKNQLQVHMTHRLHPILGDHMYSSRVKHVLGTPVHLDPHEVLPATQDVGPVLKRALLIRSGLLHMLPLHLHCHELILPKWKNKTDVCFRVPLPDYFWKMLQLLNLSPPLLNEPSLDT